MCADTSGHEHISPLDSSLRLHVRVYMHACPRSIRPCTPSTALQKTLSSSAKLEPLGMSLMGRTAAPVGLSLRIPLPVTSPSHTPRSRSRLHPSGAHRRLNARGPAPVSCQQPCKPHRTPPALNFLPLSHTAMAQRAIFDLIKDTSPLNHHRAQSSDVARDQTEVPQQIV